MTEIDHRVVIAIRFGYLSGRSVIVSRSRILGIE